MLTKGASSNEKAVGLDERKILKRESEEGQNYVVHVLPCVVVFT